MRDGSSLNQISSDLREIRRKLDIIEREVVSHRGRTMNGSSTLTRLEKQEERRRVFVYREERFAFDAKVSRDKMLAALSAGAIALSFTLSVKTSILGVGRVLLGIAMLCFALNLIAVLINYHFISKVHESFVSDINKGEEKDKRATIISAIKWISRSSFTMFFIGMFLFAAVSWLYLFVY